MSLGTVSSCLNEAREQQAVPSCHVLALFWTDFSFKETRGLSGAIFLHSLEVLHPCLLKKKVSM